MADTQSHSTDVDLDKTDELPILEGSFADFDVEDDAVRMDHTAVLPPTPSLAVAAPDFVRPSSVDLPSLAESVRSVEERIARQNAEYDTLSRAYQRTRDAEAAAVARAEEALRESERHQGESRALRDSLAAREATIVQVLHSLGERDAQLAALQQEHAKIVPALEATSKSTAQLDAELQNSRARTHALEVALQSSRNAAAALEVQLKRGESELNAARSELGATQMQAVSYLELLRTREWRRGFDQNLFREMDAQVGAAHLGSSALESERDRLRARAAELESQLAVRERIIAEARAQGSADAQRVAELLEAAQLKQAEHVTQIAGLRSEQTAQIARLQSEAEIHEQELGVLMAHLQEARRPIQSIEADVRRLTEELAAKSTAFQQLDAENHSLRASLERTRGQLEEREFLIRRLERSESNNANVLGRLQTSIERLGSVQGNLGTGAGPAADWSAELIRIDGDRPVTHVLSRRTRIGRAAGCELQIDSGSVSRHHALVLVGPREAVIEDLNSTNGVLVNGRKVSRQTLSDGDTVTIGEIQFRYFARPAAPSPEPKPPDPGV